MKHRSYNNEISNIKHNFDRTELGNVGLMFQKRAIHALTFPLILKRIIGYNDI